MARNPLPQAIVHTLNEHEPSGWHDDTDVYTTKMYVWPYWLSVLRQVMTSSKLLQTRSKINYNHTSKNYQSLFSTKLHRGPDLNRPSFWARSNTTPSYRSPLVQTRLGSETHYTSFSQAVWYCNVLALAGPHQQGLASRHACCTESLQTP